LASNSTSHHRRKLQDTVRRYSRGSGFPLDRIPKLLSNLHFNCIPVQAQTTTFFNHGGRSQDFLLYTQLRRGGSLLRHIKIWPQKSVGSDYVLVIWKYSALKCLTPYPKVFAWYLTHSLPVMPINPRASEVTVKSKSYATTQSPKALPSPAETALSIITPPAVTLNVLKEAKEAGISAVWLQPGSFNDDVMKFARKEFKTAIGGTEGDGIDSNGDEGWCVLVDGEDGLNLAGRSWKAQRL
jgi:CoA binding domain